MGEKLDQRRNQSFWKQAKMNSNNPKPMGHSKGSPEREVYSNTGLPKKNRNSSNKQPNHAPTRI